ncbi:hypothetical protein [Methyloraptor flagellatus]|uniref:Uncharacterized protein n=1 Tax=Methyloraptor flagellatus TaxID=3162530 RepID=A0AAU7XJS3_9HYPH
MAVAAGLVDIDVVVGVLDGRDPPAAAGQFGDQTLDQCGLAGVLPADDTEQAVLRRHAERSETGRWAPGGSEQTRVTRCDPGWRRA